MANYANASDTLKRLALQYQGLMDAADAFDQLSRMDSLKTTAQAEADKAVAEAEAAKAEAEIAKSEAKKAKVKVAEMLQKAGEEANDIIATAQGHAQGIVDQANAKAGEIDQGAVDRLAGALADVNANRARIVNEINNAQDRLDGLVLDIKVKTDEAIAAEARLLKVQAQIAKYLG